MPERYVVATGNPDKAREIGEVFSRIFDALFVLLPLHAANRALVGFVIVDPADSVASRPLPIVLDAPDVEETGATLFENARIKAHAVSRATGLAAIADDTGLEVDALDGAPGVYSARYAGADATYADNVSKLLTELVACGAVTAGTRGARFATVAMAAWPDGREVSGRGAVTGTIAPSARGTQGFGYDPVFVPNGGDGRTFAEMTSAEKHAVSHRGRAFHALVAELRG